MRSTGGMLPHALCGSGSGDNRIDVAAHNSELAQRPQRLESASPGRVLKRGLGDMSHTMLEEESDGDEEEAVRTPGERIEGSGNEARSGRDHALLDLVATKCRATDRRC
jgi:hypothetical protein